MGKFGKRYEKMLAAAIAISVECHTGQTDKSGSPYIFHPLRVMEKVKGIRYKTVAILHDVIEDTPEMTIDKLRNAGIIDEDVLTALDVITKDKRRSYEDYLHLVNSNLLARRVKLADIEDNLSPDRLYKLPLDVCFELVKKYHMALNILEDNTTEEKI